MSLPQAKILLEKINALHKSMNLGSDGIIPIERDLMLSYLRQLYDVFRDVDEKTVTSAPPPPRPQVVSSPPPPVAPVAPPPAPTVHPDPTSVPPPRPEPPKATYQAPPPPPAPTPTPVVETPRPTPPPPVVAPTSRSATPAIESLFAVREARELSEKLGERSVSDLTRALAINDRLLYANTLFGKSMDEMNRALNRLNQIGSMDAAKPILVEYARQYDWPDEEKADMARDFIKLVRRRYS